MTLGRIEKLLGIMGSIIQFDRKLITQKKAKPVANCAFILKLEEQDNREKTAWTVLV